MASHEAARRAVKAGYTDVSVMGDGIAGWKAAGQPTVTPGSQNADNS
jgi:rhodanese-related sulfurtransferase